jgi:hypothetical protein
VCIAPRPTLALVSHLLKCFLVGKLPCPLTFSLTRVTDLRSTSVPWHTRNGTKIHYNLPMIRPGSSLSNLRPDKKKGFKENTRSIQFVPGDWIWRLYPKLRPDKLHKPNTGPWLLMCKNSTVNYRIQHTADSQPTVVHVDRLACYYPSSELPTWLPTHTGERVSSSTQTESVLGPEKGTFDPRAPEEPQKPRASEE